MASTVVAGLRIAASASGMSVFSGAQKTLLGLKTVTEKLNAKSVELGQSIKQSMGTGGVQAVAALNTQYLRLSQSIDKARVNQEQLQSRLARRDQLKTDRSNLRSGALETLAVGVSAALPVKLAIDYESAMADVKKVVNFDKPEGFDTLRNEILELTRSLPLAASDLASIAASGGQLGVASTDLKQFTTSVAKMATAFDMSAEAAGDSMAKLANVYQIPIKEIDRLGDAINELSNSSPAKASDIVSALSRVGGVAKAFGLTETQAAALSNTFISLGKPPEVAATAINGMLIKLQTADKQSVKFQEALESINISASSLKTSIGKDAQGALSDFLGTVSLVPKADRMGLLVDLFGLEYADDVAVLAGSMETYAGSLALIKDASNYKGSMEKEFQARAATTANNLQLLKNGLAELGINLGSAVLPRLNELINTVRPVFTSFATWAKENAGVVGGVLKLVTGVVALRLGFIALSYGVSLGASAFNGVGIAMSVASGKMAVLNTSIIATRMAPLIAGVNGLKIALPGLSASMAVLGTVIAATPIGWIIGGIAAVAAAGFLIYKYWEPIKAWTGGFFGGLMEGLKPIGDAFSSAFAPLAPLISGLGTLLKPVIQWFSELLSPVELSGEALGQASSSGMAFGRIVGAAVSGLLTPLRWVLEGIGEIPRAFSGGLGSMAALITNFSPLGLFYRAFAGVMSYFGVELPSKFTDFGGMLIAGLVEGLRTKMGAVRDSIVGVGESIKGWFTSALDIHSPSRVFIGYGGNVSEGAAIGIAGQTGLIRKAALGMVAATAVSLAAPQAATAAPSALARQAQEFASATQPSALALGAPMAGATSNGGVTVHLTQQFTISGGSGGTQEQILKAGRMGFDEFKRMLEQVEHDRRRRSYGPQ
ncbi:phage tail tape measure protein [Pseudomonas sp. FSL R10-0765]|uniref:phage tail tape measure protein n=1 Tax=Pseudomonas sp. FSL R10-0765 TaxID=2662195 RepID=UPI00129812B0|nr:phage tail tape measure protein [Pseudomonas sp. FSL R10-0765]MQT44449.1 phage tail tape measure protein [Pseudomonas sp. FSL R10-0765]